MKSFLLTVTTLFLGLTVYVNPNSTNFCKNLGNTALAASTAQNSSTSVFCYTPQGMPIRLAQASLDLNAEHPGVRFSITNESGMSLSRLEVSLCVLDTNNQPLRATNYVLQPSADGNYFLEAGPREVGTRRVLALIEVAGRDSQRAAALPANLWTIPSLGYIPGLINGEPVVALFGEDKDKVAQESFCDKAYEKVNGNAAGSKGACPGGVKAFSCDEGKQSYSFECFPPPK